MATAGLSRVREALRGSALVAGTLLAVFARPAPAQEPKVLWDMGDRTLMRRSVLIAPDQFSVGRAEHISRAFLAANRERYRLLQLSIFTDELDARRTGSGKGSTDVSYEGWRQLYELYGRRPQPMAETIVTQRGAVMRWRDAVGHVGRVVLKGQDPLVVRLDGSTFEILELAVSRGEDDYMYSPLAPTRVYLAVRTRAPGLERARKYTLLLAKQWGLAHVSASFRQDSWFITNERFPLVYRFEETMPPPTEAEYRASATNSCLLASGRIHCDCQGRCPPSASGH